METSSQGITVQFRFTRTHAYLALAVVLAAYEAALLEAEIP